MSTTGPVPGVTPAVGPTPATPVAAPTAAAQLAAQLAASTPLLDISMADPAQAATRAVATAREQAAERQGAMAPLLADLTAALQATSAPPPVRAAIAQVLALQTPATPMLDGPTLQRAVAQSGVMLEARLAATIPGATPPSPSASSPTASSPTTLGATPSGAPPAAQLNGQPLPDLKAALLTLQSALKSLPTPPMAAQSAAPQAPVAGLATYAAAAAEPPLNAPGPASAPVSPQAAPSATGAAPPGVTQALEAVAAPPAVKAAVAQVLASHAPALSTLDAPTLRDAIARLQPLLEGPPEPSPAAPAAPPPAADVETALNVLQGLLKSVQSAPPRRAAPPAPPTRDGDLAAQAAPSSRDIEPETALERLPAEVEQVLARQTLHQFASAPDGTKAPTWVFELPLLTAQGQTVAQFAVSRDGGRRGGSDADEDKSAWRARFALDVPPLGKVHVHLRMDGDRSSAVLWAEEGEALERLRAAGGLLAGALGGEVTFHPGAPRPAPPAAPGQFVDQKS